MAGKRMPMSLTMLIFRFHGYLIVSHLLVIIVLHILSIGFAQGLANTPPRGWNSYDSFSWIVNEEQFLANAQIVASTLKSKGYEYVVVDFLWFRKQAAGASATSPGFDIIDKWGRPVPDPVRWPSTAGGKGFAPIAERVHSMGLKLGIHVMRGISTAAVASNTPVLGAKGSPDGVGGRPWTARDIALTSSPCSWMSRCFVSVNTSSEGGHAFINSLYQQYASWGVDFVKHDCVFGADDLSLDEIRTVSQAIVNTGRPIVYSLSPGVSATPAMGMAVNKLVHMYRVTRDHWDTWGAVELHFDVARDFAAAGLIGAMGLQGGQSWPDLDMLPLGRLTDPGANKGPHRSTNLSPDEQKTQVTLWAMAKSPLMYGGDLRHIDQSTLDIITNSVVLEINGFSSGNAEITAATSPGNQALPALNIGTCSDAKSTNWFLQNSSIPGEPDRLCWTPSTVSMIPARFEHCLNWTTLRTFSDSDSWQLTKSARSVSRLGTAHAWSSQGKNLCMETLHKFSSVDMFHSSSLQAVGSFTTDRLFSPCSKDKTQTWQLTPNGKLINPSTEQCAIVTAQAKVSRIWTARGSDGQYYVAFFNLGTSMSVVTLSVDKLIRSHSVETDGGQHSSSSSSSSLSSSPSFSSFSAGAAVVSSASGWQCTGIDVWNNQKPLVITESLSAAVPPHGCVLYSLTCTITS